MKPQFYFGFLLTILTFSLLTEGKRVMSWDEDKSEEKPKPEEIHVVTKDKTKLENEEESNLKHERKPATLRNLTFLITGKNLDESKKPKEPTHLNPYISMFYQSSESDLNAFSSEVIPGHTNPSWTQVFSFMYKKGTAQKIKFKVKSRVAKKTDQLLGEATMEVDEYVAKDEQIELKLNGGSAGDSASIHVEKTLPISFRLHARGLDRKDTFNSKSDPYVKCYWRIGPDGPSVKFAKTSVIDNVEDADWPDIITYDAYQPGKDQYWYFQVYDEDGITSDDFLGEAFVNIDAFVENEQMRYKTMALKKGTLSIELI